VIRSAIRGPRPAYPNRTSKPLRRSARWTYQIDHRTAGQRLQDRAQLNRVQRTRKASQPSRAARFGRPTKAIATYPQIAGPPNGRGGKPTGVYYEQLSVLLLAQVQRQQREIDWLKREVMKHR
jgi:hypothetical protein